MRMSKRYHLNVLFGALAVSCLLAGAAMAEETKKDAGGNKPPETILFDKTGKMAPVKFPHALHGKKNGCPACHEGKEPLFAMKRSDKGLKMADIYAGKACGACHDGKKDKAFAAKTGCMKCHKK